MLGWVQWAMYIHKQHVSKSLTALFRYNWDTLPEGLSSLSVCTVDEGRWAAEHRSSLLCQMSGAGIKTGNQGHDVVSNQKAYKRLFYNIDACGL